MPRPNAPWWDTCTLRAGEALATPCTRSAAPRNEQLKTVGIANTCGGAAQFHNFWWARASYIAKGLNEPKFGLEIERHVYEFWLGEAGSRFQYDENVTQTLSLCAPKYAQSPTPIPPKCDELIDDHAHEFGPGEKMNNMKYAILCSEQMLDRLGLRIYGNN